MYRSQYPQELKAAVDDMLNAADDRKLLLGSLIERVFPAAHRPISGGTHFGPDSEARWLRDRRVAHKDILRLYLERIAGEGLHAFADAEQAWNLITNRDDFDAYLRSLPYPRRGSVISRLSTYEQDFKLEHAVPGTAVLLNLIPDVPEDGGGIFRIEPRIVVGRITFRLLRAVGDPHAVAEAVRHILPNLNTLSAKLELITAVGYERVPAISSSRKPTPKSSSGSGVTRCGPQSRTRWPPSGTWLACSTSRTPSAPRKSHRSSCPTIRT